MIHNPLAISNYFIKKAFASGEEITPMRVLKLVYISHGWHLALFDEELINEGVQAWKYGPVVPSVYEEFKSFGRNTITKMGTEGGTTPMVEDTQTERFLDTIWERYLKFNGLQLSELTHQPNTPWDITWNINGGCDMQGAIIANDLIKTHYKSKINA